MSAIRISPDPWVKDAMWQTFIDYVGANGRVVFGDANGPIKIITVNGPVGRVARGELCLNVPDFTINRCPTSIFIEKADGTFCARLIFTPPVMHPGQEFCWRSNW